MKSALFTNFSTQEFVGYWDGKGKKFGPGQSLYMPEYLARHFAKHLANRELLEGAKTNPGLERCTSPKRPDDVPEFMALFNRAFTPDETEIDLTGGKDPVEIQMEVANRNRPQMNAAPEAEEVPTGASMVIQTPADDEDAFEGKPKEALGAQNGPKKGSKA